uniref:Uncharacterized protein n=1 Tax=Desulfovibrio sp. U5L TaxID=596152 RepID=I2PYI7_9BACT
MSLPRPTLRRALYAGLAVVILVLGAVVWFGTWYYPAMGLAGIPKDGYRQAMELAARGMAASEGLAYEDFDFLKFRQVERGGEAYAWGAARCRAADGSTSFYWVYLEWSKKRGQWLRNYSLELAAPDDEIYFTRFEPRQLGRARLALGKLLGQLAAHVREARDRPAGAAGGQGLQRPGL